MKIICKSQDLIDAVNTVQKAVPSKSTQQVLEGILLECTSELKLTGNNNEIAIEYIVPCSVLQKGTIILNSKLFGEIVRKLPDAEVCIEVNNNKVIIDCMKSHFEMTSMLEDGFPKIPIIEKDFDYKIKESILKDMLRGTAFAIGTDEKKPNLTGALFECSDNKFVIVAIDGYRMALRRLIDTVSMEDFSVIVPANALNELVKILQNDTRDVNIYVNRNLICFEFGNCKFVSRLIDGEFLNYNNVIPDYFETKIMLNTKKFLISVDRTYFAAPEDKKYPIMMDVTEEKLIITANTGIGNVREEFECEIIGSAVRVGFNPKYLIDALRSIEDEKIELFLTSNIGPATIKPLEGNSYAYMFLPVRVSNQRDDHQEDYE